MSPNKDQLAVYRTLELPQKMMKLVQTVIRNNDQIGMNRKHESIFHNKLSPYHTKVRLWSNRNVAA